MTEQSRAAFEAWFTERKKYKPNMWEKHETEYKLLEEAFQAGEYEASKQPTEPAQQSVKAASEVVEDLWRQHGQEYKTRISHYEFNAIYELIIKSLTPQPTAQGGGWQPIETAPTEGRFLIYCPNQTYKINEVTRGISEYHGKITHGFVGGAAGFYCESDATHFKSVSTPTNKGE